MRLAFRAVIRADRQQPGVLALRAGIGLEAHGGEPGDLAQPALELREQLGVALGLIARGERVDAAELAPGDRDHLGRRVELHRARAERDHRGSEREVLVLEALQVAQHLGLGVAAAEDRVREVRARAAQRRRDGGRRVRAQGGDVLAEREDAHEVGQVGVVHRLVERHGDPRRRQGAQVDAPGAGGRVHLRRGRGVGLERDGVEERVVQHLEAERAGGVRQHPRARVHQLGDLPHAVRAMPHRVHAGAHREQHLRGADVARRLLAADVLLARAERHAQAGPAGAVLRDADDAPGELPLVLVLRREKRRVRAAVTEWHAETLRVADGDVGAPLAGRHEQREREQVGRGRDQRARLVRALGERAEVARAAVGGRILHQRADDAARELERVGIGDHDVHALRRGARSHDGDRLRMALLVHQEDRVGPRLHDGVGHVHRFGGRRGLVEQRCVRDGQRREVGDHRLEIEQRLEPALGDLGLVGRVRRVPARVLEDVPQDHRGRHRVVVAHAEIRTEHLVACGEAAQLGERLALALRRRQVERPAEPDALGDDRVDERVEGRIADGLEHRAHVRDVGADVARGEAVGMLRYVSH